MKRATNLKELRLQDNNIGNPGITAIAQACAQNKTLKVLDLGHNTILNDKIVNRNKHHDSFFQIVEDSLLG